MVADRRRVAWAFDAAWLVALAVYVVAGAARVPFHGDESTQIAMSRDYFTLVQCRDLDAVLYDPSPADPAMQELRLLNGTVNKMTIGLAWDAAHLTVSDLNDQWMWGFEDPTGTWDEWSYNTAFGHMPGDHLLHVARLPSALFAALSVWAVFGITRLAAAAHGRAAAWAASLIYATTPAVLINGRRAMMEGSLLAFSTLAVLAALLLMRRVRAGRAAAGYTLAFGAVSGLAVASKHPALVTVAALFLALALEPLIRPGGTLRGIFDRRAIIRLAAAGLVALIVFLALNPAWWSAPLAMPEKILAQRTDLLNGQVQAYGGYGGPLDRLRGLVNQAFFAAPQYYEVPYWRGFIGDQIAQYEASGLAGRGTGPLWGAALAAACGAGLIALARAWHGPAWGVLVWVSVTALALLIMTPLAWQRYYLPLQPPLAVIEGCGAAWVGAALVRGARRWYAKGQGLDA